MGLTQYNKGVKKEYRVKKKLENEGCIVLRSAGSHGFADLVSINKEKQTIQFIQCKSKSFPESQKKKLMETYHFLNNGNIFETSFIVI